MDALLRITQQGRPASESFRGINTSTQVVTDALMSKNNQSSNPVLWKPNPTIIHLYNTTGATLEQYTPVGLGEPACLPSLNEAEFRRHIVLKSDTTSTKFGVCLDAILDGCIGRVVVSGVVQVKGDIPNSQLLWTDASVGGNRIVCLGSGFMGVVVFKTQSQPGKRVLLADFVGTPTGYIRCWYGGTNAGLVEYSDGNDLDNWPIGAQVFSLSELSGACYVP